MVEVSNAEDGGVFAPDVKFTEVNHEFATLVGAYGGYVFGGQLMFGGGGYWQANSTNGLHMAYGGPVVEWRAVRGRRSGSICTRSSAAAPNTRITTTATTATAVAPTWTRAIEGHDVLPPRYYPYPYH